ncbi:MAG: hypothetical protein ACK56F_01310, partial [bacterium]
FYDTDRYGNRHEFKVSRLAVYKGLIVAYRRPVIGPDQFGQEQKTPYHVADIARLAEAHDQFASLSSLEVDERSSGQSDSKAPQSSMPEVEEREGIADEYCSSTIPDGAPHSQSLCLVPCVAHTA